MEFAFPISQLPFWLLAAAVGVAAVALTLRQLERRRLRRVDRFAEHDLATRLMSGYNARQRKPLAVLTVAGFVLLALTLFQPRFGEAWREVGRASRDIVVVLDTSESMRAENPLPSRIERAKQEVASLVDRASGDRFALVAFSGAAALQCPLTLDHGYVKSVLDAIDTNTISQEGTNIAAALAEARALLDEERQNDARYDRDARAVLLISDGEQVEGNAVDEAHRLGELARVFVVGVGDPNGTPIEVPRWMGPYRGRLPGAGTHVSKLDEANLERVALAGNGAYARSQADNWGIMQLYERFRALSARDVAGEVRMQLVNRYQWFLAGAVACFVAEGVWLLLLPRLRKRAAAGAGRPGEAATSAAARAALVVLMLPLLGSIPAAAESFDERLEKANALLRGGQVEEATAMYRELQVERPDSDRLQLALGCARYDGAMALPDDAPPAAAAEQLSAALERFADAGDAAEPEVRRRAGFNRANTLTQLALQQAGANQRDAALDGFREAIAAYEDLLERAPDHRGARQNLDYARYRLKEMLQNPPPPPEEQQQQRQQQDEQSGEQPEEDQQGEGEEQQDQEHQSEQPQDQQQQDDGQQSDAQQSDGSSGDRPEQGADPPPEPPGQDSDAAEPGEPDPGEAEPGGAEQEPRQMDRQTVEALLRSLEEVDEAEQRRMRTAPRDDRLRTEWW
jgi:Ca-activated chloride channel family protein